MVSSCLVPRFSCLATDTFFTAIIAAVGFLQAYMHFCAGFGWLAFRGVFSFGLVLIEKIEAHEMIKGIRAYRALTGFRDRLPVDERAIASIVVQVSKIMNENQQNSQIDFNRLTRCNRGCSVVDARVLLASAHGTKRELKKNDGSNIAGKKANRSANR